MEKVAFYDAHFHALTLAHPNFLSFIDTLRRRRLESLYAQATSPDYLMGAIFTKGGERVRNLLSAMENDVAHLFALVEDDLAGRYAKPGDGPPLLLGKELRLGRLRFDRLVIVPLVMDFELAEAPRSDAYYDRPPVKEAGVQARELLEGIRDYRRARPDGFLELRPFLGVNTRHHTMESLAALVEPAFAGYRRGRDAARDSFLAMRDFDPAREADFPLRFAGLKVYPPLGFDPWPDGGPEREKVDWLWSFCERHDIPVVTHCDDQGFRVIPLEEAWTYTAPARWEGVLRAHPGLRLDFAHFGTQYSRPVLRARSMGLREALSQSTEWTDAILHLIGEYPRVYTDISFNGSDPAYYEHFLATLGRLPGPAREHSMTRIMFGSDFIVNLTKVRSYADYFRHFGNSGLPDEWKRLMGHDNPEAFLSGD